MRVITTERKNIGFKFMLWFKNSSEIDANFAEIIKSTTANMLLKKYIRILFILFIISFQKWGFVYLKYVRI